MKDEDIDIVISCKCGEHIATIRNKFLISDKYHIVFSEGVKLVPDIKVNRGLLNTTYTLKNSMTLYKETNNDKT